jgi:hypothetical protein
LALFLGVLLDEDVDERSHMTSKTAVSHLSSHHRDTLAQILHHPVGHNIEWRAVTSLLEVVATVEEAHGGKLLVTLGGETQMFEPPRHKDIEAQQVVDLRRMLTNAGYGTEAGAAKP